jgi:nitroreductase
LIRDLILKNRSCRRFFQDVPVDLDDLRHLVDLARCSASGANKQPLKYILSVDPRTNAIIFPHLAWAGYLKEWLGPVEGERPAAYIIVLADRMIGPAGCDHGIAAQSMLLGATEEGLGGCMIGAIRKAELSQALAIPEQYEIMLVLALGKPKETVVLDPVGPDGDIRYWRDEQQVHHVPKRSLDEIIVG